MNRRDFLLSGAAAIGVVGAAATLLRMGGPQPALAAEKFEVTKTEAEWQRHPVRRRLSTCCARKAPSIPAPARCSTSTARVFSPAPAATCRSIRRRRNSIPAPAGRVSGRSRQRGRQDRRQVARHDPHRSALPPLRRPSRPCLRRRPAADRPAPLHQRRGADLQARRGLTLRHDNKKLRACGPEFLRGQSLSGVDWRSFPKLLRMVLRVSARRLRRRRARPAC